MQYQSHAPTTSESYQCGISTYNRSQPTRICIRFFYTCNTPDVISRVHDVTRLRNRLKTGRGVEQLTRLIIDALIWTLVHILEDKFSRRCEAASHSIRTDTDKLQPKKTQVACSEDSDDSMTATRYRQHQRRRSLKLRKQPATTSSKAGPAAVCNGFCFCFLQPTAAKVPISL